MRLVCIVTCLLFVVLATLLAPASGGTTLSQRSRTTPAPTKRERLPYTPPLGGGEKRERKEGTPPKPVTQRPSLGSRYTTTKRVPHFSKTTAKTNPCNCNCNLTVGSDICAGLDKEQETFANQCQLDCYNCTHNKRYKIIKLGKC